MRYANHLRDEVIELRSKLMQSESENEALKAYVYAGRNTDTDEGTEGGDRNAFNHHFENGRTSSIAA